MSSKIEKFLMSKGVEINTNKEGKCVIVCDNIPNLSSLFQEFNIGEFTDLDNNKKSKNKIVKIKDNRFKEIEKCKESSKILDFSLETENLLDIEKCNFTKNCVNEKRSEIVSNLSLKRYPIITIELLNNIFIAYDEIFFNGYIGHHLRENNITLFINLSFLLFEKAYSIEKGEDGLLSITFGILPCMGVNSLNVSKCRLGELEIRNRGEIIMYMVESSIIEILLNFKNEILTNKYYTYAYNKRFYDIFKRKQNCDVITYIDDKKYYIENLITNSLKNEKFYCNDIVQFYGVFNKNDNCEQLITGRVEKISGSKCHLVIGQNYKYIIETVVLIVVANIVDIQIFEMLEKRLNIYSAKC